MDDARFQIVFRKMDEEVSVEPALWQRGESGPSRDELDEIEELRRVVLEVLEEPIACYTTT
jgi:hypothetical protein